MSAASPASSQVRRTAAAAPARSAPPQHAEQAARAPARSAPLFAFDAPSAEDEIRIRLDDIPRMQATMDIEGFKPTLLSRLFDLVAPLGGR